MNEDKRITKLHGTIIADARVDDVVKTLTNLEAAKQDTLIAGAGIKLENNVISLDVADGDTLRF